MAEKNQYDSAPETEKHIKNVQDLLWKVIEQIANRSKFHDGSKLNPPEKECYDIYTPLLKELTYGSDEYKATLENMSHALQHHYRVNRHHPEHFENGVNGMNLIDLVEMLADWKAASLRHADGDIIKSIEINKKRFGISDQLSQIFENTIRDLNWK